MIKSPEHGMNPEMIFKNVEREERRAPHHVARERAIFEKEEQSPEHVLGVRGIFEKEEQSKAKQSKAKQSPEHGLGGFYFWRMHKRASA
jgi:hypothetical protein